MRAAVLEAASSKLVEAAILLLLAGEDRLATEVEEITELVDFSALVEPLDAHAPKYPTLTALRIDCISDFLNHPRLLPKPVRERSDLLASLNGLVACHHRGLCRGGLYARRVLLPAMPHGKAEADQLASTNLDGTHHRIAFSTAALREVRRVGAKRQAVANGGLARQAAGTQRMTRGASLD